MKDKSKFSINAKNIGSVNVADTIENITQTFEFSDSPKQQPKSEEKPVIIAGDKSVKVFISYAREDLVIAKRLHGDLKKAGASPWFDEEDLLIGENWKAAITRAMRESQYFIALLSSTSLSKRGYVRKEMKMAFDILDEFPSDDIFILPVRIDDCEAQDEKLRNIHWADLFPSYDEGLRKILRTITRQ